ncbi:MAG: universal stress protein [Actinomycetes bacterium]
MGELLVCVDFSDASDRVITAAVRLAASTNLTLRVIHVAASESELAGYDNESFEATTPDKRAGALRDEHATLEAITDRLRTAGIDAADPAIVMGHTAKEIVRLAHDSDAELIMVGSHGHGGIHHLLVGSVTEDLLRHSSVPVIVVPVRQ